MLLVPVLVLAKPMPQTFFVWIEAQAQSNRILSYSDYSSGENDAQVSEIVLDLGCWNI